MEGVFLQNKKYHVEPITWREEPNDAQLGQILFYLVAHQLKMLLAVMVPPPVMGLFIARWTCNMLAIF